MVEDNLEEKKTDLSKNSKNLFASIIKIALILALLVCGIILSIMTLMPDPSASKPCYLGYYAHCSFTPFSTIILLPIVIILLFLLIKQIKNLKKSTSNKSN